jgi:parallel beta-helix repeat protein
MKNIIQLSLSLILVFIVAIPIVNGINLNAKKQVDLNEIRNETIFVGGIGPDNYSSIQEAINNATGGDTIFVFNDSSPYFENLVINKSINLIGENKNDTIIDGMYGNFIVFIKVDDVKIMNFTIRNSGGFYSDAGIYTNSKGNVISNCIFYRSRTAIFINETSENEINKCIFHTNGEGIFCRKSSNLIIKNSYFTHNSFGINILDSNSILIEGCYANTNGYGYHIYGSSDIEIKKCAAYNNNDNQGGIFVKVCENILIDNCILYHNGHGLTIGKSSDINILNSDFRFNTHVAISFLINNRNIIVENCEIANTLNNAILVRDNNSCKLSNNNIYNSIFGIYSKTSNVDARRNWWGSILGPALFEYKSRDRIFPQGGWIRFFPWTIFKNRNTGANWEIKKDLFPIELVDSRFDEIDLPGQDSDEDSVPDWWEEKWGYDPDIWDDHKNLDPDRDALNNIEECYTDQYGSNPFYRDIFLEVDWVKETAPNRPNRPTLDLIDRLEKIFSIHQINLHIDMGNLDGGEEIPYIANFTLPELRDMYWDYFLHNDLNNPRKGIFHYTILCDFGVFGGFAFVGWDNLDSFNIAVGALSNSYPLVEREYVAIATIMHELGHTMSLTVDDYRGIDNNVAGTAFTSQWFKFRNYKSVLHYRYVFEILDYSDGSNGREDFDDWSNLDFSYFKSTNFILPKNLSNE